MHYFIFNPQSKSGKGLRIWRNIKKYLKENLIEFKVYKTSVDKNATYYVQNIVSNFKGQLKIIILGGDGSINEAIQGLSDSDFDRVLLGYIPTGSSNDFARAMGYSKDYMSHVKNLLSSDNYKSLDLGLAQYDPHETLGYTNRKFVVSCGFGFDAAVCEETNNSKLKKVFNFFKLGKVSYFAICLKQLASHELMPAKITLYDEENHMGNDSDRVILLDNCYFVTAMNTAYQGGGIKFCPNAINDDGYLDICYANDISKFRILCTLPFAYSGKHVGKKGVGITRCKSLKIEYDLPQWVHTDGEVKTKASHITITCLPQKLKFIV